MLGQSCFDVFLKYCIQVNNISIFTRTFTICDDFSFLILLYNTMSEQNKKNIVIQQEMVRDAVESENNCKKCCAKCNKDCCNCFVCCVKSWSCCLNAVQGCCLIGAAGCLMCSDGCTGCSKCIEQVDCDGK